MTVDEYIQLELTAERRHEYITGQLFEMWGDKRTNNKVAGRIYIYLTSQLEAKGA